MVEFIDRNKDKPFFLYFSPEAVHSSNAETPSRLDYYTTVAALVDKSAPEHLDGVNMIPYLAGEKTGDAHEFLFWLNNDPTDAPRRHLTAVR